MNSAIASDALCNLVPFVQFKKCEKHPWRKACYFTKSSTPPWVFFTFLKLYKWYQIAQNIKYYVWILNFSGAMITNTEQPGLGMVEDGTQCGDGKVRKRSQFSITKRHWYGSNK